MTTWILYRFTVTAKLGFIYHIPGPDEDPDDPSTNTCPLDPVLENKLNMRAALPKQIFGMLVPKELPDVRTLMPYSLRLPHARDALDCTFDLMGPVSFSQEELEDIKAFHAAMMEGPQKKKDPKKVAEELRRLTDAARKALGDLPDADELDPPPKPAADPKPAPAPQAGPSAPSAAAPSSSAAVEQSISTDGLATDTQIPPAGQGSPGKPSPSASPEDAVPLEQQQAAGQQEAAAAAPPAASAAASAAASPLDSAAVPSAVAMQTQQSEDTDMNAISLPDEAKEVQPEGSASQPDSSATADGLANIPEPSQADTAAAAAAAADTPNDSAQPDEAAKSDDPVSTDTVAEDANKASTTEPPKCQDPVHVWNELTKHQEGDNEGFEDKFIHNYFFVPLKLWLDWEDVAAKLPADAPKELDWEAVRHVKHGWKPLTTLEEVSSQQAAGDSAMEIDGAQAIPRQIGNTAPGDHLVPNEAMQSGAAIPSKDKPTAVGSMAGGGSVPDTAPKAVKMGPLDPQRLANSVVVTTYNATPYFYEGIDPELTPQSRFPDDKLKLQAVVEQEEEDDFLKPKPPRETDTPTDQQTAKPADESAGTDNDKGAEGQPREAAAEAAAKPVTVAGRESPTADTPDEFVVRLIASKQAATFTDYFK